MQDIQNIYIAIDDSGTLSKYEDAIIYGGIIFFNKNEVDNFIKKYKNIVNNIKCKYCKNKCNNKCPELKHYNLNQKDKFKFINYLKKYYLIACTINNKKIYKNIIENKKTKGRFLDYSVKILIKKTIVNLIKNNIIDEEKDLNITIYIDEQNYKSNGYYNLKESIFEELKYGMINFKNNYNFKPIIKGNLTIKLYFKDSSKSFLIQAADLVAGTTRKIIIKENNKNFEYINLLLFLP